MTLLWNSCYNKGWVDRNTGINSDNMTEAPKSVAASSMWMYIDTSGISYTRPVGNIGQITNEADLIIGSEAYRIH